MDDKKRRFSMYADLSMFIVAIIWGGGFVAVKGSLGEASPYYIITIRFTIAFVLLSLIYFRKFKLIDKKNIRGGIIIGIFLFLGFAAQTVGMKYTTAGKNAFLTGTYVVMVPFLNWIIKKKFPGIKSILAGFITLIGIGFLTISGKLLLGKGDLLTLLCALFFAVQIIAIEYYARGCDPILLTIVQLGTAALLSFICAISFETVPHNINRDFILQMGYLSIFSTTVAAVIQNVAQKYTASTHAALIMSLESVFGSIFSVLILGELFTHNMVIGCILIFSAIVISEIN